MESDEELVKQWLDGKESAFEVLYKRFRAPLYRYITFNFNGGDADDLYHETWARAIKNIESRSPNAPFKAWLYTIARNLIIDSLRASKPTDPIDEEALLDNSADLSEQCSQAELKVLIRSRISRLPNDQRDTFLLHQEAEFSLREIAELSSQPIERIKSRWRYAVASIKRGLNYE